MSMQADALKMCIVVNMLNIVKQWAYDRLQIHLPHTYYSSGGNSNRIYGLERREIMTLRVLIDDINKYGDGKFIARVNHTSSGIIVAIPTKKVELILFDRDFMTPGIWGMVRRFTKIDQDPEDDAPWYTYIHKELYDKIVKDLTNLKQK